MKKPVDRIMRRLLALPPSAPARTSGCRARGLRDYGLLRALPLVAVHVGAVAALFIGASWPLWILALGLFLVRMFGVTAGYHRYFSHRSFKTSRVMQFLLAVLAQSSSQRGILWWASHHRAHHKHSDTRRDVHSPKQFGFWHSHMGWLYDGNDDTNYDRVKDLSRFPELVVLNKLWWIPPILLGVALTVAFGWAGLLVGFSVSTVLTWHATFSVNSLVHVWGKRRYETTDTSRNNWFVALLTLGEGWHNNHHHFQGSARAGFYWWEIDVTYYVLRALAAVRLVWDLKPPAARVYDRSCSSRTNPEAPAVAA